MRMCAHPIMHTQKSEGKLWELGLSFPLRVLVMRPKSYLSSPPRKAKPLAVHEGKASVEGPVSASARSCHVYAFAAALDRLLTSFCLLVCELQSEVVIAFSFSRSLQALAPVLSEVPASFSLDTPQSPLSCVFCSCSAPLSSAEP